MKNEFKNLSLGFTPETNSGKLVRGFTLIEIIISIGILALIASLGLFISMDFFRNSSSRSENNIIVSLLEKARGQSLNNIDQIRHGVHFQTSPLKYILFECPGGTPQCTSYTPSSGDLIIDSSYKVSITSPSLPLDVIFNQLDGSSSAVSIVVSDGIKTYTISINSEGRIDW